MGEPVSAVLVLGGYGAVGRRLAPLLREGGDTVVSAGRDPDRADRRVDLAEPGLSSYLAALDGVDVVVNASGAEDPRLAELATRHGAAFVDVTATPAYVAALERLDLPRPVLVSVGLAPGLTNLLAAA
ncbi:saccharopine dehydrogenase NADP-binding domain-containing protein, partial [Actinocorallia lasiicapitis]